MRITAIAVPFDGWGRPGNQAGAAQALRDAGLLEAFDGHHLQPAPALRLPPPDPSRGSVTSLLNEAALTQMVRQVGEQVSLSVERGRLPVLYGGDCTTLLGSIPRLNQLRRTGLVFVDGHEDTTPLDVSPDGEAANTELGLLTGITGHLLHGPLRAAVGVLDTSQVALLGPRDRVWRAQLNVGSLADCGAWFRDWHDVAAAPTRTAQGAVHAVLTNAEHYWLHVDLDVLDPAQFRAQGVPVDDGHPGGLTWQQLHDVLTSAIRTSAPAGLSIAIYDPDQDPDRHDAKKIVAMMAAVAAALPDRQT